jgi:hypothetical protein
MEKSTVWIDDLARGEEEERGKERESYHTWRFYHMVMPQAPNNIFPWIKLDYRISVDLKGIA